MTVRGQGRREEEVIEEKALEDLRDFLAVASVYLNIGKKALKTSNPLVVQALKTLLQTFIDVRGKLEPELGKLSSIKAKALHRDFSNYKKAGFTEVQAFQLVLASIKPVDLSAAINNVSRDVFSSKNKD